MSDIIPAGASTRPHVVEVRGKGGTWRTYARAADRAEAERVALPLRLHLPPERIRLRPWNPSDRANLHHDDRTALRYALRRSAVTVPALAARLGDPREDVFANRATRALRRLRDAEFLRPNDALGIGAHVLTPAGRHLAVSLNPDRTMTMKADKTPPIINADAKDTKRVAIPPQNSVPLTARGSGTMAAPRGPETFPHTRRAKG